MVFTIDQDATEDVTGVLITLTDTSNWSNNDQGFIRFDFVRTFTLKDAYGATIATLVIPADTDSVTYTLPTGSAGIFLESIFTITGVQNYTNTKKYPFYRILKNLYRIKLKKGCCSDKRSDSMLGNVDQLMRGIELAGVTGNGVEWQSYVNASRAYLKS